jgi:hypothetical protein
MGDYFRFFKNNRPQQVLSYWTSGEAFAPIRIESDNVDMVESLTTQLLTIAGPDLDIALTLS